MAEGGRAFSNTDLALIVTKEKEKQNSRTGPRGPPTDRLPRFPKYEGVKSGPTFISLAGSAGRSGVLFT